MHNCKVLLKDTLYHDFLPLFFLVRSTNLVIPPNGVCLTTHKNFQLNYGKVFLLLYDLLKANIKNNADKQSEGERETGK